MKLNPLADRVVLKMDETEQTTQSGLILTAHSEEKSNEAVVVAVGPGSKDVKMVVKAGDKVIVNKALGAEVKDGTDEYIVVRQGDILAIVE